MTDDQRDAGGYILALVWFAIAAVLLVMLAIK